MNRPRSCLGARVADLADGRLSPAETERALAHVAVCPACRAALQAQRSVSGGLRATAAETGPATPPDDLVSRLLRIPEQPVDEHDAGTAAIPLQGGAGSRPVGPAGVRPRTRPGAPRRGRRRRVALGTALGATALALAAAVGGSAALDAQVTTPTPPIAPVVDTFAVEHAASTDGLALNGPRYETIAFVGDSPSASPAPSAP